jgi:hypothetical protein
MTPEAGHNAHDPSYFAHVWPEILALITRGPDLLLFHGRW